MPENTQKYQTANAFRRALEDRLKNISKQQSVPLERRKTHNIPEKLEPPPDVLKQSYREMAEECGVTKKSMIDAFRLFEEYWKNISSRNH